MSGSNPFRHRKPAPRTDADTADVAPRGGSGARGQPPALPPRAANSDSGGYFSGQDPLRPRPGKTVRIASPPTERIPISPMTEDELESPVFNLHAVAHSNHRGSPPPLSRGDTTSSSEDEDEEEEGDDPFNPNNPDSSGSENAEVVRDTFRQNQRSSWSLAVDPDGLSSGHEHKPEGPAQDNFSKPMGFAGGSETSLANKGGDGSSGSGRATLDVDSFKRLLLTGDAGGGQGQRQRTAPGHSSTAAISSKEGITDSTITSPSGRPDSASTYVQDNTRHTLPTPANDSEAGHHKEKKKPPPPKTRHGKPIKSDEQQTVPSQQPTPPGSSSSLSVSEPLGQGSRSLPSTDKAPSAAFEGGQPTTDTDSSVLQNPPAISSPGSSQFKRPPTPPLARRQSQLRSSKNALSRSNSGRVTQSSANKMNSAPSTSQRVPPPPPRRQERISMTSLSDPPSQYKTPFPTASASELGSETTGSQQSLSRTPSTSSTKQAQRPSNSQPPRPPPPRRLRGSSRSSTDSGNPQANTTTEVTKASEQEGVEPVPDTSNANDILADLSKLQREVDELRGQYASRTQH